MKAVIIQTAFIGDVILCTPMIEALLKAGWEAGFVAKPEAAAVLKNDARLARLHVYDKRGMDRGVGGIARIAKELREEGYDAAVIPHRSVRSAAAAYLAGIRKRVGFDRSAGKMMFTDVVPYDRDIHEIERNHRLIQWIGVESEPLPPSITVSDADRKKASSQFDAWGIAESDTVIGIGPGSKWFTKQWGEERFAALARLLVTRSGCRVVCFGGPEERGLCEGIAAVEPENIFNAAGVLSLTGAAAALEKVTAVVSNDNGFMHLAVAAGRPVAAVFGPTIPEFGFAPWGDRHTVLGRELYCRPCSIHGTKSCPEEHFRCMTEITPESVYETVRGYL